MTCMYDVHAVKAAALSGDSWYQDAHLHTCMQAPPAYHLWLHRALGASRSLKPRLHQLISWCSYASSTHMAACGAKLIAGGL